MTILAIDPGTEQSAYVVWDGKKILEKGILENNIMLDRIHGTNGGVIGEHNIDHMLIEMIASYGMPVGKTVFETCVWIGRFYETAHKAITLELTYRKDIKMHHCGTNRAKDSNIRRALIDKYGEKGTKKNQGVTYGLNKDMWAAFALATYYAETH